MKIIGYILLTLILVFIFLKLFLKRHKSDKLNSQGLLYLNESKYTKALDKFKQAYELEDRDDAKKVMHLRNMSLAYVGLNENVLAVNTKKVALKLCPENSYDYFVTKGDIDLIEGNIESAITNFKRAIEINPEKLEANNSLGLVYVGDYGIEFMDLEKALIYNKKALKLYPFSITKNVLGRNYFLLEDYEKADKYFSEILNEYPNDLDTKYSLGIIKFQLQDFKTAKNLLKQVAKYKPEYLEDDYEILKELNIEV